MAFYLTSCLVWGIFVDAHKPLAISLPLHFQMTPLQNLREPQSSRHLTPEPALAMELATKELRSNPSWGMTLRHPRALKECVAALKSLELLADILYDSQ